MKLSDGGEHLGSLGGQEDQSTNSNSNNTDLNSKVRRTTSGGTFAYIERNGQAEDIDQPSEMAIYQADLMEMNNDRPKWFYQYQKNKKQFALKLKSFTFGPPLKMREL